LFFSEYIVQILKINLDNKFRDERDKKSIAEIVI
jgi:hypothetical protein